jgi:hypothetical protein
MTKFKEFDDDQRGALKEFLLCALDRRVKEDMENTNHAYKLLALGNGAGIALLASFIGVVAGRGQEVGDLVAPLWKFLLGCVLAALIYAPLMAVASQAVTHQANQAIQFIRNEIDLEQMQGWGLSKRGRLVVSILALSSLALFIAGVVQCIWILNSLKP